MTSYYNVYIKAIQVKLILKSMLESRENTTMSNGSCSLNISS